MKTEYKHITFWNFHVDWDIKKARYTCSNKSGETLGHIAWYEPWKQYCFYNSQEIILSESCLKDIADFLYQCNNINNLT